MIVLKIKDDEPSKLSSTDELSKTWRVCTKVKDSLENGSRLENLSWRLWFAHNNNDKKKKKCAAVNTTLFKIPDDFDFNKAQQQQQKKKNEMEYKRKLSLQQKKQAAFLLDKREEFTLHQYTSDQAVDQVIELDDIFNSFQSYLNPLEENPTSQQLDHLINASWPTTHTFPTTTTTTTANDTAVYVSSEMMPPIPNGTLHSRLLTTLPKQTLESAERLLTTTTNNNNNNMFQSTPNTPFMNSTSYMENNPFIHHTTSKSLPPSRASSPPAPSIIKKRSSAINTTSPSEGKSPICSNCNTTTTPLWRRSANDELLCNACGL